MAYAAGDVLTAAEMNGITGPTNSFGTAATVWATSGTAPSIGNGTFVSRYRIDTKWVDVVYVITFGSTTSAGTGAWQLSLPTTNRTNQTGLWVARAYDNSSSPTIGFPITVDLGTGAVLIRCAATTAGNIDRQVTNTQPFTWATSDVLTVTGRYEAA